MLAEIAADPKDDGRRYPVFVLLDGWAQVAWVDCPSLSIGGDALMAKRTNGVDEGDQPVGGSRPPDRSEDAVPVSSLERNADGLPRVERGKDVHRVLEELDLALADPQTGDGRLYQRNGELVITRGLTADDAKRLRIKFAPEAIVIAPLKPASLLPRITEHCDYGYYGFEEQKQPDGTSVRKQVWKKEVPTATMLASFLSKAFWAHIRPLRGIASTPIVHLDGSVVASGYDETTQYIVASSVTLGRVPEQPTHDEARAALTELSEPFAEFPFETDAERFAPVALILTLLLRPVIRGNVPAFVQSAPQKNCGKSLATKAACLIATGHIPAANTWAKSEEEQEKMIGAAADAGALVLFFDNISEGAIIGGAPLDKVLTCDGQNSFRVLGRTDLKHLPWNAVVAFTANRARIGGDSDRRLLQSQIIRRDVPIQHKHEQLLAYVAEERDRLVTAAFVLIRAWIRAGSVRADVRRLDSFEHWAWTVASMIAWAGGANVRELVRDEVGTDRDATEFALLKGLYGYLKTTGKVDTTVKALVDDVFAPKSGQDFAGLRDAIETIGGYEGRGENRKLDVRRFGRRLAAMKDVLHGNYRLKKQPEEGHGGIAKWTVVVVGLEGLEGSEGSAASSQGKEWVDGKGVYRGNGASDTIQTSQPSDPSQTDLGYPEEWDSVQ